jgi:hypothetical protein
MIVEANNESFSTYPSELRELEELESRIRRSIPAQQWSAASVHVIVNGAPNRNTRRRIRFEVPKTAASVSSTIKGKQSKSASSILPRRVRRFKERQESKTGSQGDRNSVDTEPTVPEEATVKCDPRYEDPRFKDRRIVKAVRARSMPAGMGSLGVRALHMKVHIGDPDASPTMGRLDSGADITLISEEFFNSIPGLPRPREGL